jgi:hypothetical protein
MFKLGFLMFSRLQNKVGRRTVQKYSFYFVIFSEFISRFDWTPTYIPMYISSNILYDSENTMLENAHLETSLIFFKVKTWLTRLDAHSQKIWSKLVQAIVIIVL